MPQLNYLNDTGLGQGISNVGQSLSRATLGMAAMRQRQAEMQLQHEMQMRELESQIRIEGVREKLYGAQEKGAVASAEYDAARTRQTDGLTRLADVVQKSAYGRRMAGVTGEPSVENAKKTEEATLAGALSAAAVLKSSPAAQLLLGRNIPEGGTAVNSLGEVIGKGEPKLEPDRVINSPMSSDLYMLRGGKDLEKIKSGQPYSAKATDPSLVLSRIASALETSEKMDMGTNTVNELNELFLEALTNMRGKSETGSTTTTGSPVRITTKEEYMKLPPGTSYIGPDGKPATKRQ